MIEAKKQDEYFIRFVSVSGGKDSTALYLWAIDKFGSNGFIPIFADTGHEHPVTVNYVKNLHNMTNGPAVVIVKADFTERLKKKNKPVSGNPFLDLIVWKGRVPSSKAQFCTEHIKLQPIREYINKIKGDRLPVSYVGIRAGESPRRAKMPPEELSGYFDCLIIRPLLKWSESDVFDYLKAKNVIPNPLYELGYSRVGCFPCIHANKKELAILPSWVWEKLDRWEKAVGRSWFPSGILPGTRGTRKIPTIPEVKAWSKTLHGGKQINLFLDGEKDPPSCMSTWGACE